MTETKFPVSLKHGRRSKVTFENKLDRQFAESVVAGLCHPGPVDLSQGDGLPWEVLHHQLHHVRKLSTAVGGAERQRTRLQANDRKVHSLFRAMVLDERLVLK